MKVTDNTFYTFMVSEGVIDPKRRLSIEQKANALGDDFIGSPDYKKWRFEYYFYPNNQAFLEHIAEFDTPTEIYKILQDQLYAYKERTPIEPSVSFFEDPVILTNQWLENTQFICEEAYRETQKGVYKLAVKWCERVKNQIDTRHGLNSVSNTTHRHPSLHQPAPASRSTITAPATFAELFRDPTYIEICVGALRRIDPPVINDAGEWIGKKRGPQASISILVAWVNVLEQRAKILPGVDRLQLIKLLNEHFSGLNMGGKDPGMFNKTNNIQSQYTAEFLLLIPK